MASRSTQRKGKGKAPAQPQPCRAFSNLRFALRLDPSNLKSCDTDEEKALLKKTSIEIGLIPLDSAPGTGVGLYQRRSGELEVTTAHNEEGTGTYPSRVLSQATAKLMPIQDPLQALLLPYGIVMETPSAPEGHTCAIDGHLPQRAEGEPDLPRCALRLPSGMSAKIARGSETERAMLPSELAASCWEVANPERYGDCIVTVCGVSLDVSSRAAEILKSIKSRHESKTAQRMKTN